MSFNVCIDIGGTFTDCVVAAPDGEAHIFKAPSTPDAFERGFMAVLALAAEHYGLDLEAFLEQVDGIVHGTTVSTNALIVAKVGRAGFIVNEGHPHVLLLREGPRKRSFDWSIDFPEPFVPTLLTREVGGRMDARGNEIVPLVEDDVSAAIAHFRKVGVEAIAVSLLWSMVNGGHERRVREIVHAEWPEVSVTLGHELNPIQREYRRAISTAINASLHPVVSAYVAALSDALRRAGYARELLIANCIGGMMPPEEIIDKPIFSVMSGPTLAPIAAQRLTNEADVIVVDMGGTTFDVSAVRGGQLVVTPESTIGADMLGIPKVDVRSIGAGGGSIAWVDAGGLLHVGPQSAGAKPGPACYGQGGAEPTVTDANVVLGLVNPDNFLGGRMLLDRAGAEGAVSAIAQALGIDAIEAAYAIHTSCTHNMVGAIENITVNEGIDPRESYLVCGGGATPSHIAEIATVLGIRRFLVPRLAAGLSAFGGLVSDIRFDELATHQTDARDFDFAGVNAVLAELRGRGQAFLDRAGVPAEQRRFDHAFMGRYRYQSWDIEVPIALDGEGLREEDLPSLLQAFHDMHERIYSIKDERDTVEFITWKVSATGLNTIGSDVGGRPLAGIAAGVEATETRRVYVHEAGGIVDLPIYNGPALPVGASLSGPCIVEEETTSLFLLPGMTATTTPGDAYAVTTGEASVG